jgi:hypothetical protein
VLSTHHADGIELEALRDAVRRHIIDVVIPDDLRSKSFQVLINPTGRFVIGGPKGDVGLTGRKIIVDTYGGSAPHGGGAFSGKDPSKVDRSAAYMARFLARKVVARGWAARALVQIAYAIGVAEPVSFSVEKSGNETGSSRNLAADLAAEFDLRPGGIIEALDLKRLLCYSTAAYGHFGRSEDGLPWEVSWCLSKRTRVEAISPPALRIMEAVQVYVSHRGKKYGCFLNSCGLCPSVIACEGKLLPKLTAGAAGCRARHSGAAWFPSPCPAECGCLEAPPRSGH